MTAGQCTLVQLTGTPGGGGGGGGTTGTNVSTCANAPPTTATTSQLNWLSMPSPFNGLDYKVFWSNSRQVYEIIWQSRYQTNIYFGYQPGLDVPPTDTNNRGSLGPLETETPPGLTVTGATAGRRVCVLVNRVRAGTDTGPYL